MSNNVHDQEEHDPSASPRSNGGGSTTVTLEINTDVSNAARFPAWMALAVFSAVCVAALNARRKIFDAEDTWPFVVACLSLIMGFGGVVCYHMFRPVFVGQLPEIIVVRNEGTIMGIAFGSVASSGIDGMNR